MITVILRGRLGKKFGRHWELDARTPAEALYAIDAMKGGLYEHIWELETVMQGYHVQINDKTIGEEMLLCGAVGQTVTITPLLKGTDTKGIIQIVAGVALIAVGFLTYGSSAMIGVQLVGLGLAVALGGVARLLMNTPEASLATQDKTKSSYIFSGAVNTIQQGECVPVAYGDVVVGSAVVAAGIESEDVQS